MKFDDETFDLKWSGVTLKTTDTPNTYYWDEREEIKVVFHVPDDVEIEEPQPEGKELIVVKVQKAGMKQHAQFRLSPDDTISVLIEGFCKKFSFPPETITLQFDGEDMDKNKTLRDYDIENEDLIDAVQKL